MCLARRPGHTLVCVISGPLFPLCRARRSPGRFSFRKDPEDRLRQAWTRAMLQRFEIQACAWTSARVSYAVRRTFGTTTVHDEYQVVATGHRINDKCRVTTSCLQDGVHMLPSYGRQEILGANRRTSTKESGKKRGKKFHDFFHNLQKIARRNVPLGHTKDR